MKQFKLNIFSIILITALSTLPGCQQFLNDKPQQKDTMTLDGDSNDGFQEKVEASKQTVRVVTQLLEGNGNDQEVEAALDSNSDILQYFIENTRGKTEQSYTPEELRSFLHKYILVEEGQLKYQISDDLLAQAMSLKSVLLGGGENEVTHAEVQRLIDLLQLTKKLLIANKTELAIVYKSFSDYKNMPHKELNSAYAATVIAATELGAFIDPSAANYSFDKFFQFVEQAFLFVNSPQPTWLAKAKQYLPMINLAKSILVGSSREEIISGDWQHLFPVGLKTALLYFRITSDLTDLNKLSASALNSLDGIINESSTLLIEGLGRRSEPSLFFSEIDEIFKFTLDDNKFYKQYISDVVTDNCERVFYQNRFLKNYCADSKSTIELFSTTYQTVLGRLTGSDKITSTDIENFKRYYLSWSIAQQNIEVQFNTLKSKPTQDFKQSLRRYFRKLEISDSLKKSLQRFSDVFIVKHPPEIMADGTVLISNPTLNQINSDGATQLNIIRTAVELVFKAYSGNEEDSLKGLKRTELNSFYLETRELMILLGLFDWRTKSAGKRMFLEGQIFTYSSNGNEMFELDEAIELVANLFSAGFVSSKKLRDSLELKCAIQNTKGGLGWPRLEKTCVETQLHSVVTKNIDNMPRLKSELLSLDKENRTFIYDTLLKMSHSSLSCQSSYESADIQKLMVLLTYAEIIFTKYDKNLDERLDKSEIDRAFPTIKGVMEKAVPVGFWASVATFGKERALRNGLYFVLEKNKLPTSSADYMTIIEWSWTGHQLEPLSRKKLLFLFDIVLGSLEGSPTEQISPQESCL